MMPLFRGCVMEVMEDNEFPELSGLDKEIIQLLVRISIRERERDQLARLIEMMREKLSQLNAKARAKGA